MKDKGKDRVDHYWKPHNGKDKWREWLDKKDWAPLPNDLDWRDFAREIHERHLQFDTGEEKIRWGKNTTEHFNLKEDYNYMENHDQIQPDQKYKTLWGRKQWPKIRGKYKLEENILTFIKQTIKETVSTSNLQISNDTPSQANQRILTLVNQNSPTINITPMASIN